MSTRVVLFLIDTLSTGGAEKSLLEILPRIRSYQPVICHLFPGDELAPAFTSRGLRVISLNLPPTVVSRRAVKKVSELVTDLKPIIIHSTLFRSDFVARQVARKANVILVNSLVNNSYHSSRFRGASLLLQVKVRLVQLLDAFSARRVDLFISNSHTIKLANANALGIPLHKIIVIYRGRAVREFTDVDPESVERARMLTVGYSPVFLNISRLIDRKGQSDLLKAFKTISELYSSSLLLIGGEGPSRNELEREVDSLGLSDKVKLLGRVDNVPALMKVADYFVFPSHYEGLPGVIIEAMLAQLPIIASDIPENRECLDTDMAYFFDVANVRSMQLSIVRALSQEEGSRKMAARAYGKALDTFDVELIAKKYEMAYDELLSKGDLLANKGGTV